MSVNVKVNLAPAKSVVKATNDSIGKVALEVVNIAKSSMREPKSGREYRYRYRVGAGVKFKGKSKRASITYRASAPGEPPAIRTGRLWGSVEAMKVYDGLWRVGSNVNYAADLEFGCDKYAPRPWLKPACKKAGARASEIFIRGRPAT